MNLVITSTEECSQEVVQATRLEASSLPAESDCSSAVGAAEGVADGTQTLSSRDESLQYVSNVADVRKLEEVVQTSVELHYEGSAEEGRSNEYSISKMKDTEEFGSSVNRLERMIEVQRHSLDQVRAQLEDQKKIISSILKDVSFMKSQSERRVKGEATLKSLSTSEERSEKMESEGASVVTNGEKVSRRTDVALKFQPPFWPEWTSFLERLKSLNLFQPDSQKLPEGWDIFEDPTQIKRAFYMFSRSHGPLFELLSRKDLQVLAQYGCQSIDKRNIASEQRLQNYFEIEETGTSCESSPEKSTIAPPNLSDVMRLIYSTAERAFSDKAALPYDVKSSVIHLLQELSRLNVDSEHSNLRSETAVNSSTQVKKKSSSSGRVGEAKEEDQQKQLKRTKLGKDKKEESSKIAGKAETAAKVGASTSPSKEWKCPRCSFMNLQHKNRCVECSLKRSQKADSKSNLDQEMNEKGSATSFLDEEITLEKTSTMPGSKSHIIQSKEDLEQVIDSSQEEDSTDDQFSGSLSKDENSLDGDEVSDSSGSDEDFDILDDIVKAEDSADNKKRVGGRSSLSDLVDNGMDDTRRKRQDQGSTTRRNDFGRSNDSRKQGRRYGDEPSFKSKRASKEEDDDDDDLSDDEEPQRRSSRGRSDFRERGRYGARGGRGGFRGESSDRFRGESSDRFRGDYSDRNSSRRNDRGSSGYDRSYSGDGDSEYRSTRGGRRFGGGRERGRGRSRY